MDELQTLRARAQHFSALLDSSRDAVLQMDCNGLITYWNASAQLLLGWTSAEAVGRNMEELIVPLQHRQAYHKDVARHLETEVAQVSDAPQETEAVHKSGAFVAIELSIFKLPIGNDISFGVFIRDISERRSDNNALRLSEERFLNLIEHLDDGLVLVQDERITFANERAAQICGVPINDFIFRSFTQCLHPDDRAWVLDRHRKRLDGTLVPKRYEVRVVQPGGEIHWVSISVSLVSWDGSQVALAFMSDISDRKNLEDELRAALTERETILDTSPVGIALLSRTGTLRWSNSAIEKMFGLSPEGPPPSDWRVLFTSQETFAQTFNEIDRAMRYGLAFQSELQLKKLDGSVFWASVFVKSVSPIDRTLGSVWVLTDISPRKTLEADLIRTSSEREAIFNSALVGISFNIDRRMQWVNDKYCEMTGYTREALVGQSTRMLYTDDQAFELDGEETMRDLLRNGYYSAERAILRKEGDSLWVQLSGRCISPGKPSDGVIWTLLDISERREAEIKISDALVQEKKLNMVRSRFFAATSHEFRTPLAVVMSSAELLRDYDQRLPANQRRELFRSIGAGVGRMTSLLDQAQFISQIDARDFDYSPEEIDLVKLCHDMVNAIRVQHEGSPCTVETYFSPQKQSGWFDAKLLRHIVENLLSNAFKYSPAGGGISLSVRRIENRTVIEVLDNGMGIPQTDMAHMFEPFQRGSNVGAIPGTGLGLTIVKKAIDLQHGTIQVDSKVGDFTRFTVTLRE
jgi:PAS domain S-box-containing protein